ncbi:MAG: hypothetical protein ABIH86_05090 [Planctomycetota bacterium]
MPNRPEKPVYLDELIDRLTSIEKKCVELRGPSQRQTLLEDADNELASIVSRASEFDLLELARITSIVKNTLDAIRTEAVPFTMQVMVLLFRYVSSARQFIALFRSQGVNARTDFSDLEKIAVSISGDGSAQPAPQPSSRSTSANISASARSMPSSSRTSPPPPPPPKSSPTARHPKAIIRPDGSMEKLPPSSVIPPQTEDPVTQTDSNAVPSTVSTVSGDLSALLDAAPKVKPDLQSVSRAMPQLRPVHENEAPRKMTGTTQTHLPPLPSLPAAPPLPADERIRRETGSLQRGKQPDSPKGVPLPQKPVDDMTADVDQNVLREIRDMLDLADSPAPVSTSAETPPEQPFSPPPIPPDRKTTRKQTPILSTRPAASEPDIDLAPLIEQPIADAPAPTETTEPTATQPPETAIASPNENSAHNPPPLSPIAPATAASPFTASDTEAIRGLLNDAARVLHELADDVNIDDKRVSSRFSFVIDAFSTIRAFLPEPASVDPTAAFDALKTWIAERAKKKQLDIALQMDVASVRIAPPSASALAEIARHLLDIALFTGLPPRGAQVIRIHLSQTETGELKMAVSGLSARPGLPLTLRLGELKRQIQQIGGRLTMPTPSSPEIFLPADCAALSVVVASVGDGEFIAAPSYVVADSISVSPSDVVIGTDGLPVLPSRDNLPLIPMGASLDEAESSVLIISAADVSYGLWVDKIAYSGDWLYRPSNAIPGMIGTVWRIDGNIQAAVIDAMSLADETRR